MKIGTKQVGPTIELSSIVSDPAFEARILQAAVTLFANESVFDAKSAVALAFKIADETKLQADERALEADKAETKRRKGY